MRSLNSEIIILVRDSSYYYVYGLASKNESWFTTIRMPLELHAELTETAKYVGHSANIEVISWLAAGLGVTPIKMQIDGKQIDSILD